MSGMKRHDQVPEDGQNQSDRLSSRVPAHAGKPDNRAGKVRYCNYGAMPGGGRKQHCRTDKNRQDAGGRLAGCDGGIWLTLTGSFSEGEGRGLVGSTWVEWSGGATAPWPPLPVPSLGAASIGPRQATSRACLLIGAGPRALTTDGVANDSRQRSWVVILASAHATWPPVNPLSRSAERLMPLGDPVSDPVSVASK